LATELESVGSVSAGFEQCGNVPDDRRSFSKRPWQPRQIAVTIAVRSWWYAVSVNAEPIDEHKESGIILDLTRCGQRL
jgi:hypothetical protein